MKFTTETYGLMEGLSTVTRALAARSAKPIFEGVLIEAGEDGLSLTCSDGNLTIQTDLPAMIEDNGRTVLPGRLLNDLVRKLPGTAVSMGFTDTNRVEIRSERFKGTLTGMNAMEYPEMPEVEQIAVVEMPAQKLRDIITRTVFCVATDESRQILTGVLVELTADELRMVALDGFRLAMHRCPGSYALPSGTEKLRFVVPGKVMNEISRVLPDSDAVCKLVFGKTHMRMEVGQTHLISMLLAGEYIDYERILPKSFVTETLSDKNEVEQAITRASLLAREGKNNLVRLHFAEDRLMVDSAAEVGNTQDEVPATVNGSPIDIAFNAKYLSEALRGIPDEKLCMKFNANVHPCVIEPQEGNEYLYLILPVRVRS